MLHSKRHLKHLSVNGSQTAFQTSTENGCDFVLSDVWERYFSVKIPFEIFLKASVHQTCILSLLQPGMSWAVPVTHSYVSLLVLSAISWSSVLTLASACSLHFWYPSGSQRLSNSQSVFIESGDVWGCWRVSVVYFVCGLQSQNKRAHCSTLQV